MCGRSGFLINFQTSDFLDGEDVADEVIPALKLTKITQCSSKAKQTSKSRFFFFQVRLVENNVLRQERYNGNFSL